MIHYHGSPLSGSLADQVQFYRGRNVLISYATFSQSTHSAITDICSSFCIDNGAFSFWSKGEKADNEFWSKFYQWLEDWLTHPKFDFFLVPDVIGGSEEQNNQLVASCRIPFKQKHLVTPVFHLGEDLRRFDFFEALGYSRVALGSTKGFELKTPLFWNEMRKIFDYICEQGKPRFKTHGLRMLDPEIMKEFPFSSGDSTGASHLATWDWKWEKHPYAPKSKAMRAALYADYLSNAESPVFYSPKPIQESLI